jgi:nitrous oxidase accessory protein NosD
VIELGDGDYGDAKFDGQKFAEPGIRIEGKPGGRAVFASLNLDNAEGIEIRGVEVASPATAAAISVGNSSRIAFSGIKVHGLSGHGGVGFLIRDSKGVSVADSEVSQLGSGIGHLNVDGLKVTNNNIHGLQTDGVFGGGSSHVVVSGNHITEFHPQPGDHPDAIQFWGATNGTPGTDVTISDNVITRGGGEVIQGIFIEYTNNITITRNAMTGTMYNGIALGGVQHGLIEDNFVVGASDMGSRIITRDASSDVTVRNNVAEAVVNYEAAGANPRYKEVNNSSVRAANPGDNTAMQAWLAKHGAH